MRVQRHRKKWIASLAAALLILACTCSVWAFTPVDLDAKGSISVTMKNQQKQTIAGGTLTLYQVGEVANDDWNLSFSYVNGFENCGISLDDLEDSSLAAQLETKISSSAESRTETIGADGTATFSDLELGLYLIVQKQPADGYSAVNAFLVSVPQQDGDGWIYEVDASPKVENAKAVPPTPTATPTPGKELPYTGQLTWPVPVLAIAGILVFSIGWSLRRKQAEEK